MLLNFPTSATQSAPDPLELSTDGQALLLTHFSSLAIVAPDKSCLGQNGWTDAPGSELCNNANGGKTTYREYGCQSRAFCHEIVASCCVAQGAPLEGCSTGDANLSLSFSRTNAEGGQYLYCGLPSNDASVDAGFSGPHVTSYAPLAFTPGGGDQLVTLFGSNFEQGGTIFINQDMALATTWQGDSASALVSAQYLANPGTLAGVGYVNPLAVGFDWANKSNTVDIPIGAISSDGGVPDASIGDGGSSDASISSDASVPSDASLPSDADLATDAGDAGN
jgi:hypothetical protein